MKILMFSADYYPDPGGIAAHVYYLSRALAACGAQVCVIGGHLSAWNDRPPPAGGPDNPREFHVRRWGPGGFRAIYFMVRAWQVIRKLSQERWDVVHFHNFFPDGFLLKLGPQAPVRVMTNHSSEFLIAHERERYKAIYRWVTRDLRGIVGPSHELAEKSSYFARPEQVREFIPNGVDTEQFSPGESLPGRQILGVETGVRILLSVRRHDPTKSGLPDLLQAFALLQPLPDTVLCLVGEGGQTAELKQITTSLGLQDRVKFVGTLPHSVLPAVYRAAYVSILPSLYEAVSLSGLESLACSCPVIGTQVGGIPEFVIDGETGYLAQPACPTSLADALRRLLADPDGQRRMGEKGRDLVLQKFSWKRVAQKTLLFYESCLRQTESAARSIGSERPRTALER